MISPELLRRYPFFSGLTDAHLKALAMVAEEVDLKAGTLLFTEGQPANYLYFLIDGSIDLTYIVREESSPGVHKILQVGEINPEEVFCIDSLIEPYLLTANGTAAKDCQVISIDGKALRAMMEVDCSLGFIFMKHIAKAAMERMDSIRVQLAAAWA